MGGWGGQGGGGWAYLLRVAVAPPTRARHRERGDEGESGREAKSVFASSEKICRLMQQLGALSPPAQPISPSSSPPSLPIHHSFLFALFQLLGADEAQISAAGTSASSPTSLLEPQKLSIPLHPAVWVIWGQQLLVSRKRQVGWGGGALTPTLAGWRNRRRIMLLDLR